jgi:hypothetical protein
VDAADGGVAAWQLGADEAELRLDSAGGWVPWSATVVTAAWPRAWSGSFVTSCPATRITRRLTVSLPLYRFESSVNTPPGR